MERTRRSERRVCTALPLLLGNAAAITRDVSASGIFAETDTEYSLGTPVMFSVPLDSRSGKLVLKGQGDVIRIEQRDTKIGVAVKITRSSLEAER